MKSATHWRKRFVHRKEGRSRGLGVWWTFALALVAGAAVIIAVAGNGRQVRVTYLVWHANVSLIVVILTTALLAILLDEVGGLLWRRRRRAKLDRRDELGELRARRIEPTLTPPAEPPLPQAEVSAVAAHPATFDS